MTEQPKFSEAELFLLEKLRLLGRQDETFVHLPEVLNERFDVMLERGRKRNGKYSGVFKQIFYMGDQSAFHKAYDPLHRLIETIGKGALEIPDKDIKDEIDDAGNYLDMWNCCRKKRRQGAA